MAEYKKIESGKVELTCTISGDSYKAAQESAFKKLSNKLEVKGFRKGQAPKSIAQKYINHNEVLLEAAESLAQGALNDALDEHEVELIDRPQLKLDEINDEKIVMTFECSVIPDVIVGDYKTLKYNLEDVTVDEKEVDDQIADLLDRKADLELKEDGEVEDGDTAVIDYEGFKDGVAFEGGKGENYDLLIGSHSFIPGFEEALIGMKSEETKDIDVTFPEDYHAEDLKGQAVKFTVTVHEIKKKVLPVLDDEFVKEQKIDNVNTVEELKKFTRDNLEANKKAQAENKADQELMDALSAIVEVEVPEVMINQEEENMVNNYAQRLASQGLQLQQFLQITGQTVDQLKESMKEDAIKRIKTNLGLKEIAKKENVEVTDEDISKEYENMSSQYGMPVDEIKKYIPEVDLKGDLKLQKTLDLLKK